MKKVWIFFGVAFVVISAVMLYLVKVGVSLKPASFIKPSVMTDGLKTVARDVSLRIFPDLQGASYIVWGLPATNEDSQTILNLLKIEEERARGKAISIISAGANTTTEELAKCVTPCWVLRDHDQAHELAGNKFIQEKLRPLAEQSGKHYFTLTIIPFHFGETVPDECWSEKRLDFKCIQWISVQGAERKIPKDRNKSLRYFFMNKYNEGDYFLFIEQPVGS